MPLPTQGSRGCASRSAGCVGVCRRPKPHAAMPCGTLKTWLKPVTGPVSGFQGSLWLPLGILFSKQTPSFDEICSVCLHRCGYLNGKIKNPIPRAIAWYTPKQPPPPPPPGIRCREVDAIAKSKMIGILRQTKVHKRKEGWPQSLPFLADALKHCSHP